MFGYIYLVTNKKNGMMYVGQTVQTLKDRWTEHISHARQGITKSYIARAINKYGKKYFEIVQIHVCESQEEMDLVEIFYISLLRTKTPFGYNLADGGGGVSGWQNGKGYIPSIETRNKISKSLIGNIRSKDFKRDQEFKDKISKALESRVRKPETYIKLWDTRRANGTDKIKEFCKNGHLRSTANVDASRRCKLCRRKGIQ